MNLNEYAPQKEPYHFESSQSYCSPEKVKRAAASVQEDLDLDDRDREQLNAIIELELLRYQLAKSKIDLEPYQEKVQEVVRQCDTSCERSPFDPTKVHKYFYNYLNSEYSNE